MFFELCELQWSRPPVGILVVLAFRGDRSGGRSDADRSDRGNRLGSVHAGGVCAGKSGWLQLLVLIPCAGIIIMIVLWAQQGSGVDNQYGAPPA